MGVPCVLSLRMIIISFWLIVFVACYKYDTVYIFRVFVLLFIYSSICFIYWESRRENLEHHTSVPAILTRSGLGCVESRHGHETFRSIPAGLEGLHQHRKHCQGEVSWPPRLRCNDTGFSRFLGMPYDLIISFGHRHDDFPSDSIKSYTLGSQDVRFSKSNQAKRCWTPMSHESHVPSQRSSPAVRLEGFGGKHGYDSSWFIRRRDNFELNA